jgi:hypothetical protein
LKFLVHYFFATENTEDTENRLSNHKKSNPKLQCGDYQINIFTTKQYVYNPDKISVSSVYSVAIIKDDSEQGIQRDEQDSLCKLKQNKIEFLQIMCI